MVKETNEVQCSLPVIRELHRCKSVALHPNHKPQAPSGPQEPGPQLSGWSVRNRPSFWQARVRATQCRHSTGEPLAPVTGLGQKGSSLTMIDWSLLLGPSFTVLTVPLDRVSAAVLQIKLARGGGPK